jgi:hypothetical protein
MKAAHQHRVQQLQESFMEKMKESNKEALEEREKHLRGVFLIEKERAIAEAKEKATKAYQAEQKTLIEKFTQDKMSLLTQIEQLKTSYKKESLTQSQSLEFKIHSQNVRLIQRFNFRKIIRKRLINSQRRILY